MPASSPRAGPSLPITYILSCPLPLPVSLSLEAHVPALCLCSVCYCVYLLAAGRGSVGDASLGSYSLCCSPQRRQWEMGGFLKVVGTLEQPSLELCIRAGKAVDPYNYIPSQTRILPFTESPPGPRGAPVDGDHTSPAACVSVFVPSPARRQWQQHSVGSRRTQRSGGGGGCTNTVSSLLYRRH